MLKDKPFLFGSAHLEKSEPILLTGEGRERAKTKPPSPSSEGGSRKRRFQVFLIPLYGIARLCRARRQILSKIIS